MTSRTLATFAPPVMEARRWLQGVDFDEQQPLLNLSQAAPVAPPPMPMLDHMAGLVHTNPAVHLYGPVLGLPELRGEIAARWGRIYDGRITLDQVAITSGCNQAFTATLAALCGEGDEIIVPAPYYFNHRMACDMGGVHLRPLPVGDGMLPEIDRAKAMITARTRAILLVTPNNPTGAEYPAGLIRAFFDLARQHKIALIVDETYRDFHSQPGAPHDLFTDPDWHDTLIHLYSFSKAYRLTGHRVGAIVASSDHISQVEKYLDTVTICPAQLGQHGALWGMQNLDDWLAGERAEILTRRAAMEQAMKAIPDWTLLGCGAYFAYAKIPDGIRSDDLARRLVRETGMLLLPGTMFRPDNDPAGAREMRVAFANADTDGIGDFAARLQGFSV